MVAKGETTISSSPLVAMEEPIDDATPRPVPVQYEIMSFGTDVKEWEQQSEPVISDEPVELVVPVAMPS